MDPQSPPKSAIPRRGPPLTAIRTDLAQQRAHPVLQKPRPQRLRPTEAISNQSPGVPLQPVPAKRQTSKTSLRSLFARNKALRDGKKQEPTLSALGERSGSVTPSTTNVPDTPRSVAYTVASGSTFPTSSQAPTPTESTFKSDQLQSRAKLKPEPKSKVNASWVPPPLFQAYPQALKHARLSIPNISADTILRIQAAHGSSAQRGELDGPDHGNADKNKKEAKDKRTGRRGGSNALDNIVLLSKIFVLVTAGYILQYSGEGGYDRLPEKMMRLGPGSAAFATDAIPGQPYVLQISQKSTDDGKAPTAGGRTFLSRFGLYGAESRRTVRTFLVIMSSPQEMNSWLIALRKAIESLGGKKYIPEYEGDGPEFPPSPLLATRNSRVFVSRKSSLRESNPPSPLSDTFQRLSPVPSVHRKNSYQDDISASSIKTANRRSLNAPSDAISILSATTTTTVTTNAAKEPDAAFENPRDPPLPTQSQRIRITPSTPAAKPPVAKPPVQSSATAARQLRRPTPSVAGNGTRRSILGTQSDRQAETVHRSPSLGRPLSFIRKTDPSSENSSAASQTPSVPGPGSRLSMVRKNSTQTISANDRTSRQASRKEPPSTVNSDSGVEGNVNASKADAGSDSTQDRLRSLVSPTQNSTPATSSFRSILTIPPRKQSLPVPQSPSTRNYRQSQLPDLGSVTRLPQTLPQPSQSRLPSAAQKTRPSNRLAKLSTESETTSSTGSSLARFALGNNRASKAPVTTTQPPRSTSALNQQTRNISSASLDEQHHQQKQQQQQQQQQQQEVHSSTPTSSPRTPATPLEESSRRSSLIAPQSQQTSPRQRRLQTLSLFPPAPPPDCPLPEVPPNIALRYTQRRQQPQQQQPQTQLPRPSLPSSTFSTPPPSLTPTSDIHKRSRSSELRYLHQQMANILTRKQSDVSTLTSASSSSSTTPIPTPIAATAAATAADLNSDGGAMTSESPSRR